MAKTMIVLACLLFCGCGPQTDEAEKAQVEAAKACREHGGVPILDKWGMYMRCDFLIAPAQK